MASQSTVVAPATATTTSSKPPRPTLAPWVYDYVIIFELVIDIRKTGLSCEYIILYVINFEFAIDIRNTLTSQHKTGAPAPPMQDNNEYKFNNF